MNYTEILRNLRERKKLTQREIGKILGITRSVYSDYELDLKNIPIKHLNTLANFYQVSIDFLFCLTDKKRHLNAKEEIDATVSGQRLKELRKGLKLSAKHLGDILGITDGAIYSYEKGKRVINSPYLYDICKKYKISADYLLGKIDSPKYLK